MAPSLILTLQVDDSKTAAEEWRHVAKYHPDSPASVWLNQACDIISYLHG